MQFSNFISLAQKARRHIERFNKNYPKDLTGACGIASLHLMRLANQEGAYPTFVGGNFITADLDEEGHCWIEYQNKIIDITATQFGDYPPIHISKIDDDNYEAEFRTINAHAAYEDIKWWTDYCFPLTVLSRSSSFIKKYSTRFEQLNLFSPGR